MVVHQRKIFDFGDSHQFFCRDTHRKDWALLSNWKCAVVSARVMPVVSQV